MFPQRTSSPFWQWKFVKLSRILHKWFHIQSKDDLGRSKKWSHTRMGSHCFSSVREVLQLLKIDGRYILHVAGWNLITTRKPLALKIINNLYTRQGFLHKVVCLFHIVKTRSIRYKYLSINTLRPVKPLQSHLDERCTDVSIDSTFGSGLPSATEDCHHKWSK